MYTVRTYKGYRITRMYSEDADYTHLKISHPCGQVTVTMVFAGYHDAVMTAKATIDVVIEAARIDAESMRAATEGEV